MSDINHFVKPYYGPDVVIPNWVKRTVFYDLRIQQDGLRRPDLSKQVLYQFSNNKAEMSDMINLLAINKAKNAVKNWTKESKIVCLNQIKDEILYWQNETRKWERPILIYADNILKRVKKKLNKKAYTEAFTLFTADINYFFTTYLDDDSLSLKLKDNSFLSSIESQTIEYVYKNVDQFLLTGKILDYMNFKHAAINQVRTLWPLFITLFSHVDKILYLDRKDNRGRPSYNFLTKIILEHTELFSDPNQNRSEVVNLVNRLVVSTGRELSQPVNSQTVSKYLKEAKKVNDAIYTI